MGSHNIGSYFEQVAPEFLDPRVTSAPYWAREPHLALATGRHAFMLAAQELQRRGIKQILLPEYLCSSMVDPFSCTLEVAFYRLDRELEPASDAFDCTQDSTAILVCAFFGRAAPSKTIDMVKTARGRGTLVISDTTHSPFLEPPWQYDLNVISLRKTLPMHDGALLVGQLKYDPGPLRELSRSALIQRARAAAEKRSFVVSGVTSTQPTDELRNFEDYLASVAKPAHISLESAHILDRLDLEALAERRTLNTFSLLSCLRSIPKASPLNGYEHAYAPAFLTCRVPDARAAQRALSAYGIFCPIHWPQPRALAGSRWRSDLISLPIDHRYNEFDMKRIARSLRAHIERGEQ